MNTVLVAIGTKKDLAARGLLKGGFMKKKKVDLNGIDATGFDKVDVRSCTHIPIPGKDAVVLTTHPKSAYYIDEGDDGLVLTIQDPAEFWSLSKVLVVQHR